MSNADYSGKFSAIFNVTHWLQNELFAIRLLIVFAAGILTSYAQAPNYLLPLLFVGFAVFYVIYDSCKTRWQTFFSGFLFSFGYFVAGLYWIGNALLVEGNESYLWAYPLAVAGLPFALSFFAAIALTINHSIFKLNTTANFIGFCLFLGLSEWLRGHLFTGFPWNLYGYSWLAFMPIAQTASLIGSYGLTTITIFWVAIIGYVVIPHVHNKKVIFSFVLLSFSLCASYGSWRLSSTELAYHQNFQVKLIQPNIPQVDKWKADMMVSNFEKLLSFSDKDTLAGLSTRTLIIWPETAIPPAFINNAAVNQRITALIERHNAVLLAGALNAYKDESGNNIFYNALNYWSSNTKARKIYSKSHLVPFGEYIPFQQYIPLQTVTNFSGFERGDGTQTIKIAGAPTFSSKICYEGIFPNEIVDHNTAPEWLLIITNDAWYGDSYGPYQHFEQIRFRAIEQGIPVVRVANTGITGLIDPLGRIMKQQDLMTSGVIVAPLPQPIPQKTHYSMLQKQLLN